MFDVTSLETTMSDDKITLTTRQGVDELRAIVGAWLGLDVETTAAE